MDPKNLIEDNPKESVFRVHRSAMTLPEVLDMEKEWIFSKCWIYAGHESEIPNRGDYRRRTVGGRPIFVVRGADDQVRVFLNSCTHWGTMICRQNLGNAEVFQCFYHGWTFNNRGELIGQPDPDGYPPNFDRAALALNSPPKVESYRGFYFINFDSNSEDLTTYLGEARAFLDIVIDQSEEGIRVLPGTAEYTLKANWKLMATNSIDPYHVPTTHQTYIQYLNSQDIQLLQKEGTSWGVDLGKGHGGFSGLERSSGVYGSAASRFSSEVNGQLEGIRARLVERFGEERATWWPGRVNFLIYPTLAFVGKTTLRFMEPVTPDCTEVTAWQLVPKEQSGEDLAQRINDVALFQGPGGLATPDDAEAIESCQLGFQARELEWSDVSRGMHRPPHDNDEEQIRAFWRQWHRQVSESANSPNQT